MEREVLVSGVGGQGIQLAAQTLARAAALEGREVTLFGVYGGSMRGGNTDSTVVIGDAPIEAPPIVSRAWSAIVMSLQFWEPGSRGTGMSRKLEPGGLVLLNSSLAADGGPDRERYEVVDVPASEIASRAGRELGQSMVMMGAYAKVTGVVGVESLVEGMSQSIARVPPPAHRRQRPHDPRRPRSPRSAPRAVLGRANGGAGAVNILTRGTVTIAVDRCKGCELCIPACPPDVLVDVGGPQRSTASAIRCCIPAARAARRARWCAPTGCSRCFASTTRSTSTTEPSYDATHAHGSWRGRRRWPRPRSRQVAGSSPGTR